MPRPTHPGVSRQFPTRLTRRPEPALAASTISTRIRKDRRTGTRDLSVRRRQPCCPVRGIARLLLNVLRIQGDQLIVLCGIEVFEMGLAVGRVAAAMVGLVAPFGRREFVDADRPS